jgi:hypothetical protein
MILKCPNAVQNSEFQVILPVGVEGSDILSLGATLVDLDFVHQYNGWGVRRLIPQMTPTVTAKRAIQR